MGLVFCVPQCNCYGQFQYTLTYLFRSLKLSRFRHVSCFPFLSTVCTLRMPRVTSFLWLPH